jgi:hypothetical protein
MKLKTRVFEIGKGKYENLHQLAGHPFYVKDGNGENKGYYPRDARGRQGTSESQKPG